MKKCNHDWDIGTSVWVNNVVKIKAKCIHCDKFILFDFESKLNFDERKCDDKKGK